MSPSGDVITRDVYPAPGPDTCAVTVFAPTSRSPAVVVVQAPLSLVRALPEAPTPPSSGLTGSSPRYSATRTSGELAVPLNVTVTVFEPAAAATMFFA